jgi:hypothetical protein
VPAAVETFSCALGIRSFCQISYEVSAIGLNDVIEKQCSLVCYVVFLSSVSAWYLHVPGHVFIFELCFTYYFVYNAWKVLKDLCIPRCYC